MAVTALSAISTVMSVVYLDAIEEQFRRDGVLLNLLGVENGAGPSLVWSAKLDARSAGGAYAEGADLSASDIDQHARQTATLGWAQYRTGFGAAGLAQAIAASVANSSHYPSGNLLNEEIGDAVAQLGEILAGHMYSGNHLADPRQIAGAALAIDGADDDFAGIDTGVYASWRSNEDTTTVAACSLDTIRTKLFRPIKDDTGLLPEFVTCPGAYFDFLLSKFDENAETVQTVSTFARGAVSLRQQAGARAILLDGIPFIEDRHCTSNTAYAWHSRYASIVQLPTGPSLSPDAVMAAFAALNVPVTEDVVNNMLAARQGRLTPVIEMIGKTGDSVKGQVKWYGQTKWKRRNAFGKLVISDLT